MMLKKARILATAMAMIFATVGIAHADKHKDYEREDKRQARERVDPVERETGVAPLTEEQEVVTAEEAEPQELLSTIRQENAALLQSARFAEQQAQDPRVREYAQRVSDYAAQTNRRVDELGRQLGIEFETPEPQIVNENVRQTLQLAEGPEFDQVFLDSAIFASQSGIQRLEELARDVENREIQSLMSDIRDDIEQLQSQARRLQMDLARDQRRQDMPRQRMPEGQLD